MIKDGFQMIVLMLPWYTSIGAKSFVQL